ncbi:MAG: hypothetical protein OS130_10450 [Thermodesulfobacteriota bacterium]|nr:MAG: hypothetical protein OS130_10450 [Thermodesulfobacteriota bacterium]
MDPLFWRTASYVVVFLGTALVLAGSVGTWYFGNLAEAVAPFRAPVRSASATVEVFIKTDTPYDNFYMDRGGYLAFGKGASALLTTSAAQCLGKQQGNERALFRGVFEMDATDPAVGRPVLDLRNAEFVQIEFFPMPKDAHVLEGRAVVTVNSAVRIEIKIPKQDLRDGKILVRDLGLSFQSFK